MKKTINEKHLRHIIRNVLKETMFSDEQITINIVNAVVDANLNTDEDNENQLIEDLIQPFNNDGENVLLNVTYKSWDEYHSEVTGNNYEPMTEISDNSEMEQALKHFQNVLNEYIQRGTITTEDCNNIMNNIETQL